RPARDLPPPRMLGVLRVAAALAALIDRELVHGEAQAVEHAPDDEAPTRAVPDAADGEGDDLVEVGAVLAALRAAEGEVDVVLQPARKRDVPASPELADVGCGVGVAEVLGEAEAEQEREA